MDRDIVGLIASVLGGVALLYGVIYFSVVAAIREARKDAPDGTRPGDEP
jgi:hypothetical protein